MEFIFDLDEINTTARIFLGKYSDYKIFTFTGDLGAGKTTFIESLSKEMGVLETTTSPTYSLIHEYQTKDKKIIYHMDLYRLSTLEEAIDVGIEECILSGEICMIEWPSIIEKLLPNEIVTAEIFILSENCRKLVVALP